MSHAIARIQKSKTTDSEHVLGLRGHVFGRHWHEKLGKKVNEGGNQERDCDVHIRWKRLGEAGITYSPREDEPLILAHGKHWGLFCSDLPFVETSLGFPISEHVKGLISQTPSRMPVVLEWGCGIGNAVKDLTNEPGIKGKALIFGYGDVWDVDWNKADGVKFLFFVKEHLVEYLRRAEIQVDFIFTHGAMNYLKGETLVRHLKDLATVIVSGGTIIFPTGFSGVRKELEQVTDLFTVVSSSPNPEETKHYLLTKK